MRLNKAQKEQVLQWIAEGLQSDEINERAAQAQPPYKVGRSQVRFYRRTRQVRMDQLKQAGEDDAVLAGFLTSEGRARKLATLAAVVEDELLEQGLMWTDQVKGIGQRENFQKIEYQEFNAGEVAQYRGLLDDIAKETGGRIQKHEIEEEVNVIWDLPVPGWTPPTPAPGSTD